MIEHTQKAVSIDPDNAGVNYQLANLAFFTDCNFADAAKHILKSVQKTPTYPEAQQFLAFLFILRGEMDRAWQHLQFALAIDPLNQETLFYKAYYAYRSNDFRSAIQIIEELLGKNPNNVPAVITLSYTLLKDKQYDRVLSMLSDLNEGLVTDDEKLGLRCLVSILSGDHEKSRELVKMMENNASKNTSFQAHSYLFLVYAAMGNNDEAFDLLEQSLRKKSSTLLLAFSDPLAEGLRNDPRYSTFHQEIYPPIGQDKEVLEKAPYLESTTAEDYCRKLLEFTDTESPFLNPSVSLRSLAHQIGIHPNHLSWVLNERVGKNFNEFINYYRVEHFKKLVVDPANAHISLLGLAFESGFNSKTVFNTFFKKEVGMTPRQYMKQYS